MKSLNQLLRPNPKTNSPIEEILFLEFKKYGIEPVPQYPEHPFFIDLAFPEIKLAIEADGYEFHSSPDQIERDKYRQKRLEQKGWKVIRFTGTEIHKYHQSVVAKILLTYFLEKLTEEQKKLALGRIVNHLAKMGEVKLAMQIVESYENGYMFT